MDFGPPPEAKIFFLWGSFYGFRPIDFHKFYGGATFETLVLDQHNPVVSGANRSNKDIFYSTIHILKFRAL